MFQAASDFITTNSDVLALMVAGGVVGLVAYAVKRIIKAGR
jgi:hypothetical protein